MQCREQSTNHHHFWHQLQVQEVPQTPWDLIIEGCYTHNWDFPGGPSGKELTCKCRRWKRHGFNPWVGKNPWRRAWQPTPVFLPKDSHGQRSLVGFSLCVGKDSPLKQLSRHTHTHTLIVIIGERYRLKILQGRDTYWISQGKREVGQSSGRLQSWASSCPLPMEPWRAVFHPSQEVRWYTLSPASEEISPEPWCLVFTGVLCQLPACWPQLLAPVEVELLPCVLNPPT